MFSDQPLGFCIFLHNSGAPPLLIFARTKNRSETTTWRAHFFVSPRTVRAEAFAKIHNVKERERDEVYRIGARKETRTLSGARAHSQMLREKFPAKDFSM
jgi:hypothetical protein